MVESILIGLKGGSEVRLRQAGPEIRVVEGLIDKFLGVVLIFNPDGTICPSI
jgi:hypothetical protein